MLNEGWAHYAEELMQEAGLGDDRPLVRVGQILDALMRDVRFPVIDRSAHRGHERGDFAADVC